MDTSKNRVIKPYFESVYKNTVDLNQQTIHTKTKVENVLNLFVIDSNQIQQGFTSQLRGHTFKHFNAAIKTPACRIFFKNLLTLFHTKISTLVSPSLSSHR